MVTQPNQYPHIVRTPGTVGGRPRIAGTRMAVDIFVEYYRIYEGNIEDILKGFPYLTHAQIHEALAFYEAHREEIDAYIAESDDP